MIDSADATLPAPFGLIDDATAVELRRLCKAATPGPWSNVCFQVYGLDGRHKTKVAHTGIGQRPPSEAHESEANAVLIAAARNALPRLLDDRAAYERRIAALLRTNEMLQRDCDAQNERIGAAGGVGGGGARSPPQPKVIGPPNQRRAARIIEQGIAPNA